ncbi:MAG: recombination protein RecR [Gammaproteobacteria bacterium]|nr:recombination protein RecR [Gammaproteobacteria bacterium]MYD79355.1 recombination protein RecR [Gammaproteobacteria bacterium]
MAHLVHALQTLPGVGTKTASRMALYLVHKDRESGQVLAEALQDAVAHVTSCKLCRNISDTEICDLCANNRTHSKQLCVVETPSDVVAIEHSGGFSGKYFVLHGHLSPIDGVGPSELGMDLLRSRVVEESIEEVIVATSTSSEGEATAIYIYDLLQDTKVVVSRIAHGIPVGGELEYVDMSTISHALRGRTPIDGV